MFSNKGEIRIKIINILFCLFLFILNNCNFNSNNTFKKNNKFNQPLHKKRDLS